MLSTTMPEEPPAEAIPAVAALGTEVVVPVVLTRKL
jgi:hypothetical protein